MVLRVVDPVGAPAGPAGVAPAATLDALDGAPLLPNTLPADLAHLTDSFAEAGPECAAWTYRTAWPSVVPRSRGAGAGAGPVIRPAPAEPGRYAAAAAGSRLAGAADRLWRKSAIDAAAIQSSQTIIVKKKIEKIAATPATKPNQLSQRGRTP